MARKGMDSKQFNEIMKMCKRTPHIRYISPTIHPHFGIIVSIEIFTSHEVMKLSITNNPDEDFDLYNAVVEVLEKLKER